MAKINIIETCVDCSCCVPDLTIDEWRAVCMKMNKEVIEDIYTTPYWCPLESVERHKDAIKVLVDAVQYIALNKEVPFKISVDIELSKAKAVIPDLARWQ
jgi:hypothetical protein